MKNHLKNWTTKNGYTIFQVSSGRSNSYLITYKNYGVLIDTGTTSKRKDIFQKIDDILGEEITLKYLILTHTHFDHCQNAFEIKHRYNCLIIMGTGESQYVSNGYTPLPSGTSPITLALTNFANMFKLKIFSYKPFKPDILISQNEKNIESFMHISIIPTCGHSVGSLCIIVDNEVALVGDEMLHFFKNSIFPPFSDSVSNMLQAWRIIDQSGCRVCLPGHRGEISSNLLNGNITFI